MKCHGTTIENPRGLASTEVNVLADLPVNPADARVPWAFGTTLTSTLISSTEAPRAPRTSRCLRIVVEVVLVVVVEAVTPRTTTSRTTLRPSLAGPTTPGLVTPLRR